MRIRKTNDDIIEIFFFDRMDKVIYKYPEYYNTSNDPIYKKLIDNIAIEKQSNFIDVFYKFCKLTNYECSNIKKFYFNKADKFINDLFESKMLMAYNKIDTIDECVAKDIEKFAIWCSKASQIDKFTISKYYFDIKFKHLDDTDKAYIWDNRATSFFDNINNEFIKKIIKDNQVDDISKLNFKEIKVSDETNKYINENFKTTIKNTNQKIIKLINSVFGLELIESKQISPKSKACKTQFTELSNELFEIYDRLITNKQNAKDECLFLD